MTGAAVGYEFWPRDERPLALVYRGPASLPGCPEAVAALLDDGPTSFRVRYVGPDEETPLDADALAEAAVYAQPGGGTVDDAWPHLRRHRRAVRRFVRDGGVYLGFCLGAYLASDQYGFGLVDGRVTRYARTDGSDVDTLGNTLVDIAWTDRDTTMFFQDGPMFDVDGATVLGRYTTGAPAAIVSTHGDGAVGLVGPHPEADETWYDDGWTNPVGIDPSFGHDLITQTWRARTIVDQ